MMTLIDHAALLARAQARADADLSTGPVLPPPPTAEERAQAAILADPSFSDGQIARRERLGIRFVTDVRRALRESGQLPGPRPALAPLPVEAPPPAPPAPPAPPPAPAPATSRPRPRKRRPARWEQQAAALVHRITATDDPVQRIALRRQLLRVRYIPWKRQLAQQKKQAVAA